MRPNLRAVGFAVLVPCFADALAQSPVRPEELRVPATLTCINLPAPMSFRAERGLMKVTWEWRLERGPYVSEREDAEGTFYRAPPGGAFAGRPDSLDKPSGPLTHRTSDGGFWIPRDPNAAPKLYAYFTTADAPKVVPAETENCSSLVVTRDPATSKVSAVTFAVAGAAGGAAGQALGKAMNPNTALSAGQAMAGGAIGMALVAAFINTGVGKIIYKPIDDEAFAARLKELARQAVPIKEGNTEPAPTVVKSAPSTPEAPSAPKAVATVAVAAPASVSAAPAALAPGMLWKYALRDQLYSRTRDFSVETTAVDGSNVTEKLTFGSDEQTFSTSTREISFEKHPVSGELVIELSPYLLAYLPAPALPLPQTPSGYPGPGSAEDWTIRVTEVRQEPITVPAGRFDAYRVTVRGENSKTAFQYQSGPSSAGNDFFVQRFEYSAWYVPQVGRYVQANHKTYGRQGKPLSDELVQLKTFESRRTP